MRFEDIIGRLKAYEEIIEDDDSNIETQGKLLYVNNQQQGFYIITRQMTR